MARILTKKGKNKLTIIDKLAGGETHDLFYRLPTTEERQEYEQDKVKRTDDGVKVDATGAALEAGEKILGSIRDGDFEWEDESGEIVPLSSTPGSEGYREDWKEIICDLAADHVIQLGLYVFENPTMVRNAPVKKQKKTPGKSS